MAFLQRKQERFELCKEETRESNEAMEGDREKEIYISGFSRLRVEGYLKCDLRLAYLRELETQSGNGNGISFLFFQDGSGRSETNGWLFFFFFSRTNGRLDNLLD